jgi:hypothetical protein
MGRIVRSVLLQMLPLLLALLLLLLDVVVPLLLAVVLLLEPVVLLLLAAVLLLEPVVVVLLLAPELLLALLAVVVVELLLALEVLVVPVLLELVVVAALLPPLVDPELLVAAPPAPLELVGEPVVVGPVDVLAPVLSPPCPVLPVSPPQLAKMLVAASIIARARDKSMKRTLRWWSMSPPARSTALDAFPRDQPSGHPPARRIRASRVSWTDGDDFQQCDAGARQNNPRTLRSTRAGSNTSASSAP